MEPTFVDAGLDSVFRRDGVVVTPLLDPDHVAQLRSQIDHLLPDEQAGFTGSHLGDSERARRATAAAVREVLEPAVRPFFAGHAFHSTGVFVKNAVQDTAKPLHQHWTFVDEARFCSGLVWVPLDDTTSSSGGLQVVLGSHTLKTGPRGTPDMHVDMAGTEAGAWLEQRYLQDVDVQAGSAVVMDDRLLHSSTPNRSGARRIAVGLAFHPIEAELYHFYREPDGEVARYTVDPEFFETHDWPARPSGPHVRSVMSVAPGEEVELLAQLSGLPDPRSDGLRRDAGSDASSTGRGTWLFSRDRASRRAAGGRSPRGRRSRPSP